MLIYGILILMAFLTGSYACFFFRPYYFKLIVALLLVTFLNEMIVAPLLNKEFSIHWNVAYNVFSLIDMGVWLFIFYKINSGHKVQKFILPVTVVIFIYTCIELFCLKGWKVLHSDSFRVYEIFIIILSIIYLYRILKQEYYIIAFDPFFWMCAACLLYHSILILTFTIRKNAAYWHFKDAADVFFFLQVLADTSYYLLLCYMFISGIYYSRWQKKKVSCRK